MDFLESPSGFFANVVLAQSECNVTASTMVIDMA